MAKKKDLKKIIVGMMENKDRIRNIGIIAHIDHGKTTLSDSLVAAAGMLSEAVAGEARWLDFDEEEQKRGITINAGNVSMVHELSGIDYLINLIDTPGHVDFGGEVTRAMRAVDGAMVIVDAVEGAMPQTETVLRQSLRERVKPILFINKVDRLIKELQLTPEEMQQRFAKIITKVNQLIEKFAPEEHKKDWQVGVPQGTVGFGSAVDKWATNMVVMKSSGVGFKEILDAYRDDKQDELAKPAPLHTTVLGMVVEHLPSPLEAQKYRVPKIWRGDMDSERGKSMMDCNENGPFMAVITKIVNDPHAGEVSTTRIFSGRLRAGSEVYLIGSKSKERVQQVAFYKGPFRISVEELSAGNIAAVVGLRSAQAGETLSDELDVEAFEEIKHIFEPVVTKAIEAQNPKDLPKLVEVLIKMSKEDPTLKIDINQETGEILMSGMGELHLEIKEKFIVRDWKVQVKSSPPIVVFRETVDRTSKTAEGKSPNKHNKLYIKIEPIEQEVYEKIIAGEISEGVIRKGKDERTVKELMAAGMSKDQAKKAIIIKNGNIMIDATRGVVHLGEIMDHTIHGMNDVLGRGPLAGEKSSGMKILITDAKLHEDSIHRGPAQIIPASRDAIKEAMLDAGAHLNEPIQTIRIDSPTEYMGAVTSLVQGRRGRVLEVDQESAENVAVVSDMPVSNMFGFTSKLRSATNGMGYWSLIDSRFEPLPKELQIPTILKIRKRKGMKEQIPASAFLV
ncbi:MAG: elongation factor EF-2 [Candidatus Altiarchaeota archaeon]|nr:elongation factor EF-2 [Candidatus Altiarchaeota archaeon]